MRYPQSLLQISSPILKVNDACKNEKHSSQLYTWRGQDDSFPMDKVTKYIKDSGIIHVIFPSLEDTALKEGTGHWNQQWALLVISLTPAPSPPSAGWWAPFQDSLGPPVFSPLLL